MSNLINQVIIWICVLGLFMIPSRITNNNPVYAIILLIIVFLFAAIDTGLIYNKKVN